MPDDADQEPTPNDPSPPSKRQRNRQKFPGGKPETEGVLAGHFKKGRKLTPPMLGVAESTINDWARDDLPDLLWGVVSAHLNGDQACIRIRETQEKFMEIFADGCPHPIDGRLTAFEAFSNEERLLVQKAFQEDASALATAVSPELVGVLQLFDQPPGAWFFCELGADLPNTPDAETSLNLLRSAMVDVLSDRHKNALVKSASMGWRILNRQIGFVGDTPDSLIGWPADSATRAHGDAVILSSFLSMKAIDETSDTSLSDVRHGWARQFWNQGALYAPCLLGAGPDDLDFMNSRDEQFAEASTNALGALDDTYNSFINACFDGTFGPDFYRPAKHEVVAGMIRRLYRQLRMLLDDPRRWTGEFASGEQRVVSDTKITLGWLHHQNDDAFYAQFQSYGHGKRKLNAAHMKAFQEKGGAESSEMMAKVLKQLEYQGGMEFDGSFQEVHTDNVFGTARNLAKAAELEDEYNLVYQLSSGVVHGEWWAIEDYCMQRCSEPLHLFHWVAGPAAEVITTSKFGDLMVHRFSEICALGAEILLSEQAEAETAGDADA